MIDVCCACQWRLRGGKCNAKWAVEAANAYENPEERYQELRKIYCTTCPIIDQLISKAGGDNLAGSE
jgi:hypothetical protein